MTVSVTHSTPADSSFSTTGATAWNADHTLTGVGTMAEQNANAVAVTGGAVNGTTVGATTASTGAFTTLSASSTVSGTGFSTYLASPSAIGGTTPAAGTFTTLIGGGDSANYEQITGGSAGNAVQFQSLGSDANVSLAIQPKGTGAVDLAAGSKGVNISNGNTVTAVTRTAAGTGYTGTVTWTASAPTTAGGTTASGTVPITNTGTPTVVSGGTGYTVGNVLTIVGGTPSSVAGTLTVTAVSSGVITAATYTNFATYSAYAANPVSVTGGSGSGATFNMTWGIASAFVITSAGSNYVEQPTITLSGGGGASASAYASVGSSTIIRSLAGGNSTSLDFYTPASITSNIPVLRLRDSPSGDSYPQVSSHSGYGQIVSQGNANSILKLGSNGTGSLYLNTNGTSETNQMRVSHTASAVNYVQATGAVTGSAPTISAQGSDTTLSLNLSSKGSGSNIFFQISALNAFQVTGTGTIVNRLLARAAIAAAAPALEAVGTDTDIDLTLTPKGTGNVRFGTYTASVLTPTGYITIKDSGGTTRRLLVG